MFIGDENYEHTGGRECSFILIQFSEFEIPFFFLNLPWAEFWSGPFPFPCTHRSTLLFSPAWIRPSRSIFKARFPAGLPRQHMPQPNPPLPHCCCHWDLHVNQSPSSSTWTSSPLFVPSLAGFDQGSASLLFKSGPNRRVALLPSCHTRKTVVTPPTSCYPENCSKLATPLLRCLPVGSDHVSQNALTSPSLGKR